MKEEKMTKTDYFNRAISIINGSTAEDKNDIVYFLETQIESIKNKAEKAKERAAAKKAEGDELRENVKNVLTKDFQTADEITANINIEGISKAKVIARLTQLVGLNEVEKTDVKTEDGKTKKAYKLVD